MKQASFAARLPRLPRPLRALFALVLLGALVVGLAGNGPASEPATADEPGWGHESIRQARAGLGRLSPIALANACGLGASSCYKCHNGKRAAAPKGDAAGAPWHAQHKAVNFSCVGCHQGNPRLMKDDLAHAGLLKAPRAGAESCGGCHQADRAKVEAAYKSIGGK